MGCNSSKQVLETTTSSARTNGAAKNTSSPNSNILQDYEGLRHDTCKDTESSNTTNATTTATTGTTIESVSQCATSFANPTAEAYDPTTKRGGKNHTAKPTATTTAPTTATTTATTAAVVSGNNMKKTVDSTRRTK
eukprot:Lankesteria_metandrocarpae@DN7370_c0_g1_i1.p1